MDSQIKVAYIKASPKIRFNQGDIVKDLSIPLASDYNTENKEVIFSAINLLYGIIINQDCDLEHDFNTRNNQDAKNQDKYLPNILILPAYLVDSFRAGSHRGAGITGEDWDSKRFGTIKSNNNPRFHFISANSELQIPDLVIDFKHIYTLNRNIVYKIISDVYLATIGELFRESLSHRYTHYLSRVGLPEINTR